MNVSRYMQRDAVTALPTAKASSVRECMDAHGFGLLLVAEENGTLVGFVTRASLKSIADDEPMSRIAHKARFAVGPDDTLEKAALILLENRLVLLPVTEEDGKLIGVLTQTEVLRGLAEGLGVGKEATRLCVKTSGDKEELRAVIGAVWEHDARLVSLTRGENGEAILRIQDVQDREALREEIEKRLLARRKT